MQAFYAATLHSHDASRLDQIPSSYSEDLLVETSAIVNKNPPMDLVVEYDTQHIQC
jgi:hypothetical protein